MQLNHSHWGVLCPAETPEGESCLVLDTLISTPQGLIPIGNIRNGDTVYSINPLNLEIESTKMSKYFTKTENVFEVKTLSEFKITATGDHPFLVNSEWMKLEDLTLGNKVIIKYTTQISQTKAGIWARILGFTFADAGVYRSQNTFFWGGCFGTEDDAKECMNDIEKLGYSRVIISERNTTMKSDDGRLVTQHTFRIQKGGEFCRELIQRGAPIGKKTTQRLFVPAWILDGDVQIQAEFIAGFQGGDGGSVWWGKRKGKKNAYDICFGDTLLHTSFPTEMTRFLTDIKSMMEMVGVSSPLDIRHKKSRYDEKTVVILPMSRSAESIVSYMEKIGYRYCKQKQLKLARVTCYLRYKIKKWENQKKLKQMINYDHDHGMRPKEIMLKYAIGERTVHALFEQRESNTFPPRNILQIEEFLKTHWICEDYFSLPIISIISLGEETVADFTTLSENHSFIANGFVTHNCGLMQVSGF